MPQDQIAPDIRRDMQEKKIDVDRTVAILDNYNAGKYDGVEPVSAKEMPVIDNETVLDMTGNPTLTMESARAENRMRELLPEIKISDYGTVTGNRIVLDTGGLRALGTALYPLVSYGVLNGGSATSYADTKKNAAFNQALFDLLGKDFHRIAAQATGKPKGVTPAYINPDGSPGASFLELKMRSLLIEALRYQLRFSPDEQKPEALTPMFQMTSVYNDAEIEETYRGYRESELLGDLQRETGIDVTQAETGVQPMIAAFTHSSEGRPKRIFTSAHGTEGSTLPLPGGHGQNFSILSDVYRRLRAAGKRFVYLGNVDNLGFTVEPVSLAYLALTGKQAGFDFAFRTSVDVKGGILVVDQHNRYNCADLGPAISKEDAFRAEEGGKKILFNCATGLFNLDYLVAHLDRIVEELPVRWSDQDKDAGRYSQAEQVTWEIVGMLDDFLVFGIDKYDRFLAAKLLLETLMTSGLNLDAPSYPTSSNPAEDLKGTASKLHEGLKRKLATVYGMKLSGKRWVPKGIIELKKELQDGR